MITVLDPKQLVRYEARVQVDDLGVTTAMMHVLEEVVIVGGGAHGGAIIPDVKMAKALIDAGLVLATSRGGYVAGPKLYEWHVANVQAIYDGLSESLARAYPLQEAGYGHGV